MPNTLDPASSLDRRNSGKQTKTNNLPQHRHQHISGEPYAANKGYFLSELPDYVRKFPDDGWIPTGDTERTLVFQPVRTSINPKTGKPRKFVGSCHWKGWDMDGKIYLDDDYQCCTHGPTWLTRSYMACRTYKLIKAPAPVKVAS